MKCKLILLLICITQISKAQQKIRLIDMTDISSKFIPYKYAFESEGNQFFYYTFAKGGLQMIPVRSQGLGIVEFDNGMKELKKVELISTDKEELIIHTFTSNKTFFALTSKEKNKITKVTLYSFDINGNKNFEKEILQTDWNNKLKVQQSSDSTKIGVYATNDRNNKKEECVIDVCILNNNGVVLRNNPITLPFNSKEFDFKHLYIDNKGIFYAYMEMQMKDNKYKYDLFLINEEKTKSITINCKEAIGLLSMFETKNGLYLSGFNRHAKQESNRSPFIIKIESSLTKIDVPFDIVEPASLKSLIEKELYSDKYAFSNMLVLKHSWQNEKGEYRLAFQINDITYKKGGSITYKFINHENFYLFTFNSEFKFIDIQFCPMQALKDPDELAMPLHSFVYNDALYMIYTEQANNINLTAVEKYKRKGDDISIIRKFSPKGNIKDIKLTGALKDQYPISNATAFTKNNDIIFFSGEYGFTSGKNYKMGIFNIDIFDK